MINSILNSVKKNIGLDETYKEFDPDIIMHINTVFDILGQLGVGPEEGFQIEDDSSVWKDFLPDRKTKRFNLVKTYMYAKVRLMFDPPQTSSLLNALTETVKELESRISYEADPINTFESNETGGDKNVLCSDDP